MERSCRSTAGRHRVIATRCRPLAEILLIFALFFLLAGTRPPDVNEVHYLAKAKHYWNPAWCAGDIFLESADTHLLFFLTIGWQTLFWSLETTAWVGRVVTWGLLAWSWRRLSVALVPVRFMAVLTAGLFCCLLSCLHMAGEWLLGGVEAKGIAYAFVLFALEAIVTGRWRRVWLLLGAASAFHVLVGGWSVIAAGVVWLLSRGDRPTLGSMVPALLGGLALALPGLAPALAMSSAVDANVVQAASEIQVLDRLRHHLSFHHILLQPLVLDFEHLGIPTHRMGVRRLFFVRHLLLVAFWLLLVASLRSPPDRKRLHYFVGGACLISLLGIALDQSSLTEPARAAVLLRFYWFRLADVMVPLGAALAVGQRIERLNRSSSSSATRWLAGALLVVTLHVTDAFLRHRYDSRPRAIQQSDARGALRDRRLADWRRVCGWIADNSAADDVFLTPRRQQTFKWYSGRAEVVNWKDAPQDPQTLVEWKRRMLEVYPGNVMMRGLTAHGEAGLRRLAREFGFHYILIDRSRSIRPLGFRRVYPQPGARSVYEVYRVPPAK